MEQDKNSFSISICMERGPEERALMPIKADEDRTSQDQEEALMSCLMTHLSPEEKVKIRKLIEEIRSKLDELEDTIHIHKIDPDECPF